MYEHVKKGEYYYSLKEFEEYIGYKLGENYSFDLEGDTKVRFEIHKPSNKGKYLIFTVVFFKYEKASPKNYSNNIKYREIISKHGLFHINNVKEYYVAKCMIYKKGDPYIRFLPYIKNTFTAIDQIDVIQYIRDPMLAKLYKSDMFTYLRGSSIYKQDSISDIIEHMNKFLNMYLDTVELKHNIEKDIRKLFNIK